MSDRHEKWVRVEPGTHIEAGTPWRIEYAHAEFRADGQAAVEHSGVGSDWVVPATDDVILVDSSWKPPLVLPEPPCVIRAGIWGGMTHILYGHFADDEKQTGIAFCRAADGMTVKAEDIRWCEVLWTEAAR